VQGFELLLHLAKKQKFLRRHAIKVFDFALSFNPLLNTKKNCKHFVEEGGLPFVFAYFMQKQDEQKLKKKSQKTSEVYVKLTADEI